MAYHISGIYCLARLAWLLQSLEYIFTVHNDSDIVELTQSMNKREN